MSRAGPKEAIDAINACETLSSDEKEAAIAKCVDVNVVAVITATPAARFVGTIRNLIKSSSGESLARAA